MILSEPFYSYLRASMGSSFAAFFAGYQPETTPTKNETINANPIHWKGMIIGVLRAKANPFPTSSPNIIPIMPPARLTSIASNRNWVIMIFSLAPKAFRVPISLVLSVTETSIMFIREMDAPKRVINPIKPAPILTDFNEFIRMPDRLSALRILKLFCSPGLNFLIERIEDIASLIAASIFSGLGAKTLVTIDELEDPKSFKPVISGK